MLGKERLEFLPGVLGGIWMIAFPLVAEKAMGRFRIDLEHEILLLIRERLVNLFHMVLRDQGVLTSEEELDRAVDLAGAIQRAGITHGDAPPRRKRLPL